MILGVTASSIYKGSASAFDPSYQAILDYADANGITKPSASQQVIQNQLVLDLKSNGIWNRRIAFWMPANDGSAEFATLNWKDPSKHRWTHPVGNVPFVSNVGFRFVASEAKYIDSGFSWATDYVGSNFNDVSIDWFYSTTNINQGYFGHTDDATANFVLYYSSSSVRGTLLSLNPHSIGALYSDEWQIYYRDETRNRIIWTNGIVEDTDATNGTSFVPTTTVNFPIGAIYRVNSDTYGTYGYYEGDFSYMSVGDNLTFVSDDKLTMKGLIEGYLNAI